jgi:hypothetical protein
MEMRALNELLRGDPRARDEYLIRVEVHSRLASEPDFFLQTRTAAAGEGTQPIRLAGERNHIRANPGLRNPRRTQMRVLAFAACLGLMAVAVWGLWLRRAASRTGSTSNAVAMLTRVVDARWDRHTQSLRPGSALEPGWLRLESGLAQVVFYSGARVVIEGPTELQLVSPSEAVCPAGRLLAEVPEPAHGFRLKTSQLSVVDLGTSFGIDTIHGRTELHVFKGEVEFSAGPKLDQPLSEGKAAVVQGGAAPQLMPASPAAFALLFSLQEQSLTSDALRYERWLAASARLSKDPSLVVHLDLEDLGDSDWTLRNAVERNPSVRDATIVGCQRAEGRWPEKQALEFQSVNDRVRLAVPGNLDSLTLSAWVRVKGLDRQFNSLFMCGGFKSGGIHWLIRNDGVLSLMVLGPGPRESEIVTSPPMVTLDRFGMWTHLAVVVDGQNQQVVHYVNGSPVARKALRLGPPFQLGPAELGNWNADGGPKSAPSAIGNLSGSLDEFELFNRALTDAEVHELYADGKPESDP